MNPVSRRHFIQTTIGAAGAGLVQANWASPIARPKVKPIQGSWISIWWDDRRHGHWNDSCLKFTTKQWKLTIKEMADLGFEYLVLLAIAKGGYAFYDTPRLPKLNLACEDPIEALLAASDRYGVKFFISSDWYGPWDEKCLTDPERIRQRFAMMGEIAQKYGHHRSFYGWYWPNEAHLGPYYSDAFIRHVNECSREGRRLLPKTKTLTAPYGTYRAVYDDTYVRQLEQMDVDIIAYQDEVGCLRMTPEQSAVAYEKLRRAHDRVPQRALWADVEVFTWEGPPNQPGSPLIPAPFQRVRKQLEAVSPFVDRVLIYQYQGLMNKPGSKAFAGHPDSTRLYQEYTRWLRKV